MKKCTQYCLNVSNFMLDEVFSDLFGKSSRPITVHILQPKRKFDVTPFVDIFCKTPIIKLQATVEGAITKKQAVELRQYLKVSRQYDIFSHPTIFLR